MDAILGILVGVSLAAACGFRVFVPLLVASVAARAGYVEVIDSFAWVGSNAAVTAFGIATAAEVAAYFVPWLDNALDSLATPAAVVAGTLLSGSVMVDLDPWLRWSLAIIAGGGAAGVIQGGSVVTRGLSSVTTAGFGNPLLSAGELFGSAVLAVLAIVLPVVAIIIVLAIVAGVTGKFVIRMMARKEQHEQ